MPEMRDLSTRILCYLKPGWTFFCGWPQTIFMPLVANVGSLQMRDDFYIASWYTYPLSTYSFVTQFTWWGNPWFLRVSLKQLLAHLLLLIHRHALLHVAETGIASTCISGWRVELIKNMDTASKLGFVTDEVGAYPIYELSIQNVFSDLFLTFQLALRYTKVQPFSTPASAATQWKWPPAS